MGADFYNSPPLFLSDAELLLLANAVAAVSDGECANHCAHHRQGVPCTSCGSFAPSRSGYLTCDGYEPSFGAVVA